MSKTVIVLGGGVAGMSVAHELAERGFSVTVFEKLEDFVGGKARSVPVDEKISLPKPPVAPLPEGQMMPIQKPYPGEHGFRFFPGFYRHVIDTMSRIPFTNPRTGKKNQNGVVDNLVDCSRIMITRMGKPPIFAPGSFPKTLADVELLIHDLFHPPDTGLLPGEAKTFALKIWQLMTSCEARRQNEYEHVGWWEFMDTNKHSDAYRTLFVDGITRTLVAAKAETASTKTDGDIVLQMLFNIGNPSINADRILCGPTNETWLFPWRVYLESLGVQINYGSEVVFMNTDKDGQISSVDIMQNKEKKSYTADYYVCCIPVERAAKLFDKNADIYKLDPCLQDLDTLAKSVAWMNGIQFYLTEDIPLNRGHILMSDTPWALTAISQIQFWKDFDIKMCGDGSVKGLISVDVSNWDNPGLIHKKPARDCSKEEVLEEIWYEMKQSFNTDDTVILKDEQLKFAHIDCDIIFGNDIADFTTQGAVVKPAPFGTSVCDSNEEPLLVNQVNQWSLRPQSYTDLPNLFLASDYVKTYTDLATMEGANEAARRAVNNIIATSGVNAPYCKIWNLHEPFWLAYYKWFDEKRYKKGLRWQYHEPWFGKIVNWVFSLMKKKS